MTAPLLNRHMNNDLAHATRAAQRKLRQLEIEIEQRIEEAEALKMTEEQRQTLYNSFRSVKVEFSDLDGLSWYKMPQKRVTSPDQTFVVLTNADLASFGPHDTIRASASSRPCPRSSNSSLNISSRPFFSPSSTCPTLRRAHSSLSSPNSTSSETIKAIIHNHRATRSRSRSPVKGLFPEDAYDSDSERTIRGSDSDLDDSPRPRKERKKIRTSKRLAVSSPSAAKVSARSVLKKQAIVVSPKKLGNHDLAAPKAESEEAVTRIPPPKTTAYPAYITYSESSFTPETQCSYSKPDIRPAKGPIFPIVSKSGSATTAVYHLPTSNGH